MTQQSRRSPEPGTAADAGEGTRVPARQALITATASAAALTTLLMGFVGRVPLAPAAGLSVSGVLASQVAPEVTWPAGRSCCSPAPCC